MSEKFDELYANSIVVDACAPLPAEDGEYVRYIDGGVTAVCPTVSPQWGNLPETIAGIEYYYSLIRKDPRLLLILGVDDIYKAKKENKTGFILSFQNTTHLQADLGLIEIYYRLGVRQILLAYNSRTPVGDGCEEPENAGLSAFGIRAVKEMNRLGIIVDLSHTGYSTTMDAMDVSTKPCIFSHSNAYEVWQSPRNIKDDQAKKVAKKGGTIGINMTSYFMGAEKHPSINVFIDHLEYFAKLVGIDHVHLGFDYYQGQAEITANPAAVIKMYNDQVAAGVWNPKTYAMPPWYGPINMETPEKICNIVPALRARGFANSDIKKILGENYLRVAKEVWQ